MTEEDAYGIIEGKDAEIERLKAANLAFSNEVALSEKEIERLSGEFDRVMFVSNARAERLAKHEKLIGELAAALSIHSSTYPGAPIEKLIQRAREIV